MEENGRPWPPVAPRKNLNFSQERHLWTILYISSKWARWGWSGLEAGVDRKMRFTRRRHYRAMLLRDGMEVYWGRKIEACVTPLAHDKTCVVLLSRDPFINFEEALGKFPRLSSSLRNGELGSVRGHVDAFDASVGKVGGAGGLRCPVAAQASRLAEGFWGTRGRREDQAWCPAAKR